MTARAAGGTDWDPALYRRFEAERTRPAAELLARVSLAAPRHVVDLGCGPGNSTELLAARFPAAAVSGVDSSPAMVEAARQRLPHLRFEVADIAAWQPTDRPDLLFANAVLQWLPDHARLLPRLFEALAPGGVLAIQMPDNLAEPSHAEMRATAREPRFQPAMTAALAARDPLPALETYYDLLAPTARCVDLWRTTYAHVMPSAAAIVDWLRATGLRPFLEAVPADLRADFLARYQSRIEAAYPLRADGHRLLAFPRLFILAQRP